MNYIKPSCVNFFVKITRYSKSFLNYIKSSCIIFVLKCSWYFHIVYYWCAPNALLIKKWFYFFFSRLLTYKNSTNFLNATLLALILSLLFKCSALFKYTTPSQKSDNIFHINLGSSSTTFSNKSITSDLLISSIIQL